MAEKDQQLEHESFEPMVKWTMVLQARSPYAVRNVTIYLGAFPFRHHACDAGVCAAAGHAREAI